MYEELLMFLKRSVYAIILLTLFTLLLGSSVLADDGRINRAPYHFGGDTLFCSEETGCTLLNMNGHDLANWPQTDIATAFAKADTSGQNAKVNGDGQGTYGPMQLWAVSPDASTGNNKLCMIGFDEWNKQNDMCFQVTQDWHYLQAPLPVVVIAGAAAVDNSCDQWTVGDYVRLISNHSTTGNIFSIDTSNGTVTFGPTATITVTSFTAKCSEIEFGPT